MAKTSAQDLWMGKLSTMTPEKSETECVKECVDKTKKEIYIYMKKKRDKYVSLRLPRAIFNIYYRVNFLWVFPCVVADEERAPYCSFLSFFLCLENFMGEFRCFVESGLMFSLIVLFGCFNGYLLMYIFIFDQYSWIIYEIILLQLQTF